MITSNRVPADCIINCKYGTVINGQLATQTSVGTQTDSSLIIRAYGDSSLALPQINTRAGFKGFGINSVLQISDVFINQTISASVDVLNGQEGGAVSALRCKVRGAWRNFVHSISRNTVVAFNDYSATPDTALAPYNNNGVQIDAPANLTTGLGAEGGVYVGFNVFNGVYGDGRIIPANGKPAAGDVIALHDEQGATTLATGSIIEYNYISGSVNENAIDIQEDYGETTVRFNIVEGAKQYAFQEGAPTAAFNTGGNLYYGNVIISSRAGIHPQNANAVIVGNYIECNLTYNACITTAATATNIKIVNNIIKDLGDNDTTEGMVDLFSGTTGVFANNLCYRREGTATGTPPAVLKFRSGINKAAWTINNNAYLLERDASTANFCNDQGTFKSYATYLADNPTFDTASLQGTTRTYFSVDPAMVPAVGSILFGAGVHVDVPFNVDLRGNPFRTPPAIGGYEQLNVFVQVPTFRRTLRRSIISSPGTPSTTVTLLDTVSNILIDTAGDHIVEG